MTIRFKCPHCKKSLSVKDEYGGKKGSCPACKKGLRIPSATPVAAPADLEELAAAAFTDQPAPIAPPTEQNTVKFPCYYCEAPLEFGASLAGKQAPCPECRRIIKVPELVKNEPLDWRRPAAARGPAGARSNMELPPAPEGVWDSSGTTRRVSEDALLTAGVITEEREPWSTKQKLALGFGSSLAVCLLGGALWLGLSLRSQSQQHQAIESALKAVAKEGTKPMLDGWERDAAIHLAAGEFYLRTGKRDCAAKARDRFSNARSFLVLANKRQAAERQRRLDADLLLVELALAQLELGSADRDDHEKGRRLDWEATQNEMTQSLSNIQSQDVRREAVREVSRALIARGQEVRAESLASILGGTGFSVEMVSVVGTELLLRQQNARAEAQFQDALRTYRNPPPPAAEENATGDPLDIDFGPKAKPKPKKPVAKELPPPPVALMALGVALEKKEALEFKDRPGWGSAYAEGLALRKDIEEARRQAQGQSTSADQLHALVGVTAVALEKQALDPGDLDAVKDRVKSNTPHSLLLRAIRTGVRAQQFERVDKLAGAISDPDLKAWAHYQALRGRLAAGQESSADAFPKELRSRLPYALAVEAATRHEARTKGGTPASVASLENNLRPFGQAGSALGMQDRSLGVEARKP